MTVLRRCLPVSDTEFRFLETPEARHANMADIAYSLDLAGIAHVKALSYGQKASVQWRSDDFRAPPQTTSVGPWPRVYGDNLFLAGPFNPAGPPRSRGLRGPRYATASVQCYGWA